MTAEDTKKGVLTIGIVGAGIGGLCLAHALQRRGIAVRVFERDPTPDFRGQGYRVTIHASGLAWLEVCLPETSMARVLASSTSWTGMRMVDEQLRPIIDMKAGDTPSRSIDRRAFRRILLDGLADVSFGKEFVSYRETGEQLEVGFADGDRAVVDLLVGADGNQSRVRRQRLPDHAELHDTGYADIAARIPWSERTERWVEALGGSSLVGVMPLTEEAIVIIPQIYSGAGDDENESYLYWGLVANRSRIEGLAGDTSDGTRLLHAARALTEASHPLLRAMMDATPASDVTLLRFWTSVRHQPWATSRVTLLGDAVHSMSPMAGMGANTAIRDAGELARRLEAVRRGERPLLDAVAEFEAAMIDYGFAAVERSQANLDRISNGSPLTRRLGRGALRLLTRVLPSLPANAMRRDVARQFPPKQEERGSTRATNHA